MKCLNCNQLITFSSVDYVYIVSKYTLLRYVKCEFCGKTNQVTYTLSCVASVSDIDET